MDFILPYYFSSGEAVMVALRRTLLCSVLYCGAHPLAAVVACASKHKHKHKHTGGRAGGSAPGDGRPTCACLWACPLCAPIAGSGLFTPTGTLAGVGNWSDISGKTVAIRNGE